MAIQVLVFLTFLVASPNCGSATRDEDDEKRVIQRSDASNTTEGAITTGKPRGAVCTKNSQCDNRKCGRLGPDDALVCCWSDEMIGAWYGYDYCAKLEYGNSCTMGEDQCNEAHDGLRCQGNSCRSAEADQKNKNAEAVKRQEVVQRRKCESDANYARRNLESKISAQDRKIKSLQLEAERHAVQANKSYGKASQLGKIAMGVRLASGFLSFTPVVGSAIGAIGTAAGASLSYASANAQGAAERHTQDQNVAQIKGLGEQVEKNSMKLDAVMVQIDGAARELKKNIAFNLIYAIAEKARTMESNIHTLRDDFESLINTKGVDGEFLNRHGNIMNRIVEFVLKAEVVSQMSGEYLKDQSKKCWHTVTPEMQKDLNSLSVQGDAALRALQQALVLLPQIRDKLEIYTIEEKQKSKAKAVKRRKEADEARRAIAQAELSTDTVNCGEEGGMWGTEEGNNFVDQCKNQDEQSCRRHCTHRTGLYNTPKNFLLGTTYYKCKWIPAQNKCTSHANTYSNRGAYQQICAPGTCTKP